MAPSRRPAPSSASRAGGARSPKRLKAQKEDDVACPPEVSWDATRRRDSSSSSASSRSSGPGVDGAAAKGCLIRSTRAFLPSGGSPPRPASPSLEEMASPEEETCSLKVSRWPRRLDRHRGGPFHVARDVGEGDLGGRRLKKSMSFKIPGFFPEVFFVQTQTSEQAGARGGGLERWFSNLAALGTTWKAFKRWGLPPPTLI